MLSAAAPAHAAARPTHISHTTPHTSTHPTGKVIHSVDRSGHPEDTAARELEEETHGLIPAADSSAVLPYCPVLYSPDAKMAVYFMRYIGAEQLPSLMEQRLAGEYHKASIVEGIIKFCVLQTVSLIRVLQAASQQHPQVPVCQPVHC